MPENTQKEPYLSEDFDITESTEDPEPGAGAEHIVHAGEIDVWETLEFSERAKTSPYITIIITSTWVIVTGLSIIHSLTTGNFLLLIPPAFITVPLCIVLRFYFRGG